MAEQALGKITEQLTCPVCLECYTEPKVLACLHVFCKLCLEKLVQAGCGQEGVSVCCPSCRQLTQLPKGTVLGLQSAFHIQPLLEIQETLRKANLKREERGGGGGGFCEKCRKLEARGFCEVCNQPLCQECIQLHQTNTLSSSHTITNISCASTTNSQPKETVLYCQAHPGRVLELYCETCEELICCGCLVQNHSGEHHCSLVADAFPQQKERIVFFSKVLEQQLQAVTKAVDNLDLRSRLITDQQEALTANIKTTIQQLQEALEVRKTELIGQLDQITQQKLKTIAAQRDQIELVQTQLSNCLDFVKEGLINGSKGEILAMKKPVVNQIEEISTKMNTSLQVPLEKADTNLFIKDTDMQVCSKLGEFYTKSPCPDRSIVSGKGAATAKLGEKVTVYAELRDKHGFEIDDTATADVTCELQLCADSTTLKGRVEKGERGKYKITYEPTMRGKHRLHVKVDGKHLQGSPFAVIVKLPVTMLGSPVKTITGLRRPWGVAVNSLGQVLVTESEGSQISVFSPGGEEWIKTIGKKGLLRSQFEKPVGIAVESDDNILVTDISSVNIHKCDAGGRTIKCAGSLGYGPLEFTYPTGIGYNRTNGKIYVTEWESNHRVQILNADLTYFGTLGKEEKLFASPSDIAFDSTGNVYVVDSDHNRIMVFSQSGEYLGKLGRKEKRVHIPSSICIDDEDVVYVTERENHCVSIFTSQGQFLHSFGTRGRGPGQLNHPHGIAVDAAGHVYICDYSNNRLQVF